MSDSTPMAEKSTTMMATHVIRKRLIAKLSKSQLSYLKEITAKIAELFNIINQNVFAFFRESS